MKKKGSEKMKEKTHETKEVRQVNILDKLKKSIEDRVCYICGYRVDASEPDDSAEELMLYHFDMDHYEE